MKRQIFTFLVALLLTASGALFAQTTGTTADPNLPLTGQEPAEEEVGTTGTTGDRMGEENEMEGTTTGTVGERNLNEPMGTTDPVDTQQLNTGATGTTATGTAQPLDQNRQMDQNQQMERGLQTDTDRQTGTTALDQDRTGYATDQDRLPATGSRLPAAALIGLLALGAALVLRTGRL